MQPLLETSNPWGTTLFHDSGDYFLSENVFDQIKSAKDAANFSIYRMTDAWHAVRFLRDKRNTVMGHPSSTNLTDAALDDLFKEVMDAYKKLPWIREDDYMEEIEEIIAGMTQY